MTSGPSHLSSGTFDFSRFIKVQKTHSSSTSKLVEIEDLSLVTLKLKLLFKPSKHKALKQVAISKAKNLGLDLIEIAPNANPPVCKIMDMGKYKYDAQKKANLAKKKQKIISLKEIKMRPVTETHDYEFKVKNAKKFISKGDKVKFTIRFKGRELQHSHLGNELMGKIKEDMKDIGRVELQPKFDGKQMIMVIQPL